MLPPLNQTRWAPTEKSRLSRGEMTKLAPPRPDTRYWRCDRATRSGPTTITDVWGSPGRSGPVKLGAPKKRELNWLPIVGAEPEVAEHPDLFADLRRIGGVEARQLAIAQPAEIGGVLDIGRDARRAPLGAPAMKAISRDAAETAASAVEPQLGIGRIAEPRLEIEVGLDRAGSAPAQAQPPAAAAGLRPPAREAGSSRSSRNHQSVAAQNLRYVVRAQAPSASP